jgi:hypothetical protein
LADQAVSKLQDASFEVTKLAIFGKDYFGKDYHTEKRWLATIQPENA